MKTQRPVGFLNVDLEIEFSSALDLLAHEMGKAVLVLYSGRAKGRSRLLCMESSHSHNTPDATALALCLAVEWLSVRRRQLCDRARRKEFNVGFELNSSVRAVQTTLAPETLNRIAALGATVAFTCYRGGNSEPRCAANRSQPIRSGTNGTSGAAGSRR